MCFLSLVSLERCGGLSGFRCDGQGFNVTVIAEAAEFGLVWRCPKMSCASLNTSRAASVYCHREQYTPVLCFHTHRQHCSFPWTPASMQHPWEHCVSHADLYSDTSRGTFIHWFFFYIYLYLFSFLFLFFMYLIFFFFLFIHFYCLIFKKFYLIIFLRPNK